MGGLAEKSGERTEIDESLDWKGKGKRESLLQFRR